MASSLKTTDPKNQAEPLVAPPLCNALDDCEDRVVRSTRANGRLRDFWDLRRTPAFLVSLILHTAALLLLALLSLSRQVPQARGLNLFVPTTWQDSDEQATSVLLASGSEPPPPDPRDEEKSEPPALASGRASAALSELLIARAPEESPPASGSLAQLLQATSANFTAVFTSSGVDARRPEERRKTALARGGSPESERAVERALDWLAAHQLPSGAWSLIHDGGKCDGRCANNGSPDRFDPAATGLSLLAFLGAGYTHKGGKHREVVRKGVYFLLQIMEETPQGGSFLYQSDRGMYNHGIAAFALCEAYQLTGDSDLAGPAQQAIDFIVASQNYQGGWGYLPKQPGDLTLSGWQIMALKSAFAAGLNVPPTTIFRVDPFLQSQQTASSFFYGYGRPGKSPTCTSIGLLIRLFRGTPHTDPSILGGADFLRKEGFSSSDAYFNYYVTLFLFHVGEPFWEDWNERTREHLIATQAKAGHAAGSWFFENAYGREGGRLYTTAMCAMTLEVYYRFSPIYQQADVKFEL